MRKLPGMIDVELITREFFPESVDNPGSINCGDCYRWAYIAYKLYNDVELWSNESHAFPRQYGKFFDSESPNGEEYLEQLYCNTICHKEEQDSWCHEDIDDFVEYWDEHGRYEFDDVKDLDRKIRNFWRRYDRKHTRKMIARTKKAA